MLKRLTRTKAMYSVVYLVGYFPHQYHGKNLSSRETTHAQKKEKTKRAIPLDAVSQGRFKRHSLRFWPGDGFCEPSLRYLSLSGKELVHKGHHRNIFFCFLIDSVHICTCIRRHALE